MRKRLKILFAFLFLCIGMVTAQISKVSGIVVSEEDNEPIIGASILVKGTTTGTITDTNGKFSINKLPSNSKTLVISYVGMTTQEVPIRSGELKIVLKSDSKVIDEVVVIAYGTAKKASFTGSASTVNAKSIEKRPLTNISSALEGNTSGVQVTSALGQPGESASIRIRGFGSVNASNTPLYVVDGSVYNGNLSDINPADIETMTVLKDAASTSLYGSSAGNGVILITTKKGSSSAGFTLNMTQGFSTRAYKDYAMADIWEYYPLQWQMLKNSYITIGKTPQEAARLASNIKSVTNSDGIFNKIKYNPFSGIADNAIVNTDGSLNPMATELKWGDDLNWANEAYRTGHRQEYNLSYNSKADKSDTYASIAYLNDKGYMIKTDFERFSGRVNYNIYPNKWFKSGLNVGLTRTVSNYSTSTSDNSSSYGNLARFVRTMAPVYPIHKHDLVTGDYLNAKGEKTTNPSEYVYDYDGVRQSDPGRDALVETLWNNREISRMNTMARTYVTITPIEGLTLTANYALDNSDLRRKVYENPKVGDGTAGPARLNNLSTRNFTQTFNQIVSYNKTLDKHAIDIMGGHESYEYKYEYFYGMKTNEIIPGVNEFGNYVNVSSLNSYTDVYRKEGYFGRLNYDYDNKYYASVSYRKDGSSRFHKDNRWGDFWSFGASWRINQENFLKGVDWVNNLKLRASYGETGNDDILDADGYSAYYPYQTVYNLGMNNKLEPGAYFDIMANKDLKWETQISTDIALEFGLFDRLTGSIEFFRKESKDLLFDISRPISMGIASMTSNIGKVRNQGMEIELNYNILRTKDWTATIGTNMTLLSNKITKLPSENRENGIISGSKKLMEGHSIYEFWLRQWYGVDSNNGNGLYYFDSEQYTDSKLTADVKKTLVTGPNGEQLTNSYSYAKYDFSGSAAPKIYGGFNFNVGYKGLELSAVFSYALGGKILDTNYASMMSTSTYGSGMHKDTKNAWKQEGDKTEVPRLDSNSIHATSVGQSLSTRWLVSGDYLNLRSLTLAYSVPNKLIHNIGVKGVRVNVSAENLFMLKARQGLNPQSKFSGLTYNEYMPAKTITFGLNVSF